MAATPYPAASPKESWQAKALKTPRAGMAGLYTYKSSLVGAIKIDEKYALLSTWKYFNYVLLKAGKHKICVQTPGLSSYCNEVDLKAGKNYALEDNDSFNKIHFVKLEDIKSILLRKKLVRN